MNRLTVGMINLVNSEQQPTPAAEARLGYVCHKLNNTVEEDAVHKTHHEEEKEDIVQFNKKTT
eukprot:4191598-Amphidinium_carterae.1